MKCPICGGRFWYKYINNKEILLCENEECKYFEETTLEDYRKEVLKEDGNN